MIRMKFTQHLRCSGVGWSWVRCPMFSTISTIKMMPSSFGRVSPPHRCLASFIAFTDRQRTSHPTTSQLTAASRCTVSYWNNNPCCELSRGQQQGFTKKLRIARQKCRSIQRFLIGYNLLKRVLKKSGTFETLRVLRRSPPIAHLMPHFIR
jgi:hypothetical protein